jgi:hypothetical protein
MSEYTITTEGVLEAINHLSQIFKFMKEGRFRFYHPTIDEMATAASHYAATRQAYLAIDNGAEPLGVLEALQAMLHPYHAAKVQLIIQAINDDLDGTGCTIGDDGHFVEMV